MNNQQTVRRRGMPIERRLLEDILETCRALDRRLAVLSQDTRDANAHLDMRLGHLEARVAELQSELVDGGEDRALALRSTQH